MHLNKRYLRKIDNEDKNLFSETAKSSGQTADFEKTADKGSSYNEVEDKKICKGGILKNAPLVSNGIFGAAEKSRRRRSKRLHHIRWSEKLAVVQRHGEQQ